MMNPTRRSFLALVGAGFIASSAEASDSFVLSGTVTYVAKGAIPPGRMTIRLEEQGIMDAKTAETFKPEAMCWRIRRSARKAR